MKRHAVFFACAAALLIFGCRRSDVRTLELEIPALTAANRAEIETIIAGINDVDPAAPKTDIASKRVVIVYESMNTAKKNIEMEIAEKGYAVAEVIDGKAAPFTDTLHTVTPESVGAAAK